MNNDSFALLGVREGASLDQIRAAYIAAVKAHHPDLAASEWDRRRRTRDTAVLNVAYAELRNRPVRNESPVQTPPRGWATPAQEPFSRRTAGVGLKTLRVASPQLSWPWLLRLAGAIGAGLTASSVAGNPILCVAVFLAVSCVARDLNMRSAL